MKTRTRLLVGTLALASLAAAQAIEGTWLGTLTAGPVKMRLALKIGRAADGSLSATLDSIDQGAKDLAIDSIQLDGQTLKFEMKRLQAGFQGAGSPDGQEFAGQWTQAGSSLPLVFRRTEKAPVLKRPQEPSPPFPYSAEDVVYENPKAGVNLAGTLTLPRVKGPFPAVLLISGSGPQDRDESVMGHRPFLVVADHLTRRGIAVLRCDDRGVGKSTGRFAGATSTDFAEDAMAGVDYLKRRPEIDPKQIGLAGHSEGGIIAPMVAAKSPQIAFVVLLAGPGVTGEEILYRQGTLLLKASGAGADAIAEQRKTQEQMFALLKRESDPETLRVKAGEVLGRLPAAARQAQLQMFLSPLSQKWFRQFLTYDPRPALGQLKCPVLAITGELDLQVDPEQNLPAIAAALKAGGNRDYTTLKLPKLNHLFQTARTGAVAEYSEIEETFAPAALETVSGWILKRTRRPQ